MYLCMRVGELYWRGLRSRCLSVRASSAQTQRPVFPQWGTEVLVQCIAQALYLANTGHPTCIRMAHGGAHPAIHRGSWLREQAVPSRVW